MSTSTRVTVAQYDEMIRQGLFEPREEHRVELIHGEIVPMSPIGAAHNDILAELNEWSFEALPPKTVRVFAQGAVGIIALDSEPQPDVFWARRRGYSSELPRPDDVLLLIEVSDSSLAKDRGIKARLYAEAGIAEYWIVNLIDRQVEVLRDPAGGVYRSIQSFRSGEEVRPLAFPEAVLPVTRLFPA